MEDSSEQCKLFVGGVSWETTEEILKEHFAKYGTVVASVIAKDRNTGSSRGFAFVSFADPAAVDSALQDTHEILGRTVDVKKAIPRGEQQQSKQQSRSNRNNGCTDDSFRTKKIFVGGLSANLREEEFKSYFEKYGSITDVVVMHDNMTHRPRGFGFITFDSEDAVEKVVQNNFHQLNGKLVEVKRAIPKDGNSNSSSSSNGNGRAGSSRGSNYISYQHGSYQSYSPQYGLFPSYGSFAGYGGVAGYPFGPGVVGGTFLSGGQIGISLGFGIPPFAPRNPFNRMIGVRGSPLPYGNPVTIYPAYMNGGVRDTYATSNGYNGMASRGVSANLGSDGDV